jgi:phosphoribosyl 1,2-cyclic phosphodiesterase
MTIERRALQGFTAAHVFGLPFLIQFFERKSTAAPKSIDNPDVLAKYLRMFHDCKNNKIFRNLQITAFFSSSPTDLFSRIRQTPEDLYDLTDSCFYLLKQSGEASP